MGASGVSHMGTKKKDRRREAPILIHFCTSET